MTIFRNRRSTWLAPSRKSSGKRKKWAARYRERANRASSLLAQRAVSADPRWTRAVEDASVLPPSREGTATQLAGKMFLEVVTPEKQLLSQEVDEVIAPGSEGEFGVLPGHCHFLSTLGIGDARYRVADRTNHMAILWGYAEVTPHKVTVMAEIAEKAEDIDVDRAQAAVAKAEQRLKSGGLPSEVKEAEISLEKARLRMRLAQRAHKS